MDCFIVFIWDIFQDTTTFEVNVSASDLENFFMFDIEASITSHVHCLIHV